jgi:hypothetical protein
LPATERRPPPDLKEEKMSSRYIPYNTSIIALRHQINYTKAALLADPLVAVHAEKFEALELRWRALSDRHYELTAAVVMARARIAYADGVLNSIVDLVDKSALLLNADRKAPLYQMFFGRYTPGALKKPLLGRQLEVMRGWLPILLGQNAPEALRALGPRLSEAISEADAAVKAKQDAETVLEEFEAIGEYKKFVDDLNRLRIDTFGVLDALPLERPDLHLPRGFARRFFLQERSRYTNPTLEERIAFEREGIEGLEREVSVRRARLAELLAQKESQDREAQAREEKRAKIAELGQQMSALQAELGE